MQQATAQYMMLSKATKYEKLSGKLTISAYCSNFTWQFINSLGCKMKQQVSSDKIQFLWLLKEYVAWGMGGIEF